MTHLLDTSVYSQRLRPKPLPGVMRRWQAAGDSALAVSSICEAELRYGLAKRGSRRLWQEYVRYLENRLVVLPVDKQVADALAELKASLERVGRPRADFDLLIAATCLVHRLILATANPRHFADIPDLPVEDWSLD